MTDETPQSEPTNEVDVAAPPPIPVTVTIAAEDHQRETDAGVVNIPRGYFVAIYGDGSEIALPPSLFADMFAGHSVAIAA